MNSINLTGNICNDLELKTTPSGKYVVSFNLAVKRPFSKDTTDFIPVVAWDKNAEYVGTYGRKGSKIAVSGKLTTRKYQDKEGNNRTVFEVVCDTLDLLDGKNDAQGVETAQADQTPAPAFKAPQTPNFTPIETDSDLPF